MEVSFKVVNQFFDRTAVIKATDRATRKTLSKAGAFIRRRARSSLRRRKKVSEPGQTPSVHSDPGLKTILFAYEPTNESVVIGPVKLNKVALVDSNYSSVASLMEFGGQATIQEVSNDGGQTFRRRDLRRNPRAGEVRRSRRANYKPRPFMKPALDAEAPNFPDLFKNTVRG